MGNLTTITFRNDKYHDLGDNPNAVVVAIQNAMSGIANQRCSSFGMIPQKSVHANDNVLYFSSGNTVVQINDDLNDAFVDDAIIEMERQLINLRKRKYHKIIDEQHQANMSANSLNQLNFRQEQLFNELRAINSKDASAVQNQFTNIAHLESCKTTFAIESELHHEDELYLKIMQYFYDYEKYFNSL